MPDIRPFVSCLYKFPQIAFMIRKFSGLTQPDTFQFFSLNAVKFDF